MGIIKNYHDKKWTLQFLDALYNSIDNLIGRSRLQLRKHARKEKESTCESGLDIR
jgi:hypothetical protein